MIDREQIIEMARETGGVDIESNGYTSWVGTQTTEFLGRFAALVVAVKDEEHKEAMRWDVHSCGPTCKRYACVAIREAVAAAKAEERELCAKVCDDLTVTDGLHQAKYCANAIRARGETK